MSGPMYNFAVSPYIRGTHEHNVDVILISKGNMCSVFGNKAAFIFSIRRNITQT